MDEVAAVLRGLPGLISEIRSFKCGPDVGVNAGNWDFAVIVSLLPWATEIVYALGLGDQLEGRTFECHYPPEAQQKLIVSSSGLPENLVEEALGRLGCRAEVVSLDPHSLDDVMSDIQNVARAAGVNARADLLVDNLRARMAAVEASVSLASAGRFGADADSRRVLVLEWVDPPWGAGHWIPDMVERAGGAPMLGHKGGHAEVTMWDAVREEAPTIVVVAPCGYHLAEATEQAVA